jgi:PTS system glucitol/sorbitol-specific IIB component
MEYKSVKVEQGPSGWGGPLVITPTEERPTIACLTGCCIDPVAAKIAELTGAEVVDNFKIGVKIDKMACMVTNCGGSARCGIYPQKGVPTVNVFPCGPSGFFARFMKEDIYVSGVRPEDVSLFEDEG